MPFDSRWIVTPAASTDSGLSTSAGCAIALGLAIGGGGVVAVVSAVGPGGGGGGLGGSALLPHAARRQATRAIRIARVRHDGCAGAT